MARKRLRITVEGIVQGVGFRPCVHRLARELALGGTVRNFTGGVYIEVEGPCEAVDAFVDRLPREAPPIAVIDSISSETLPTTGQTDFVIIPSERSSGPIFVSPDVAICRDCARELADPTDRRYLHPFINCTNCGPRFTIIRQLPYDRPQTSMARFEMCDACRAEYEDIENRRYHAQPVCCNDCGPQVWLADASGRHVATGLPAIAKARQALADGAIVAVKGLGGFHLACDATNESAVRELRRRKHRWAKPFAVMAPALDAIRRFALVSDDAARLLSSPQAPIVLVPKLLPERLAPSVAADSSDYGVMLPYTPLHMLLLGTVQLPASLYNSSPPAPFLALVMTSGNISDEPLCIDNDEALGRLANIADLLLLHDRDILIGCDDSVVRTSAAGPILIRRSRGYAPLPVKLPLESPPLLAVGGHLKNTFCLATGRLAYPSQHIGELDNAASVEYFRRSLNRMCELFEITPHAVACDLHPDYTSTAIAEELAAEGDLPLIRVQHHHAHMAAALADSGLAGPAVGLICDGTGYGGDGTIWGCEILVGDLADFRRLGHLRYVALPGGEMAVHQPWRVALAWLVDTFSPDVSAWPSGAREFVQSCGDRAQAVFQLLERNLNCPLASSAGRLFDAVAALLDICRHAAYEAQAAMALEAAAARASAKLAPLPFDVQVRRGDGFSLIIDPRPCIRRLVDLFIAGAPVNALARAFHEGLANALAQAARTAATYADTDTVVLSGGTFQNRLLLERLVQLLSADDLKPVYHKNLSPNDSSLCVGQAAVAAARLSRAGHLLDAHAASAAVPGSEGE